MRSKIIEIAGKASVIALTLAGLMGVLNGLSLVAVADETTSARHLREETLVQADSEIASVSPPAAYYWYGFPMDVLGLVLDGPIYVATQGCQSMNALSHQVTTEQQQEDAWLLALGSGLVFLAQGALVTSRTVLVLADNGLFRHGTQDYYSLQLKEGKPKKFFFPHRHKWISKGGSQPEIE